MTYTEDPMEVYYGGLHVTDHPYIWNFDADFGAAETVHEAIAGMFADGEYVTSPRSSNRELTFSITIDTTTLDAAEEAALPLLAEANRPRNTITVYPGNHGTPFVLEVFKAQVQWARTEARERSGARVLEFTVPARPFVRAVDLTLTDPVSAPEPEEATVTTIDSGASTSGWSGSPGTGLDLASTGTAVRARWVDGDKYTSTAVWRSLTRSGLSVSMTSTPYLRIEWTTYSASGWNWSGRSFLVNGVEYTAADVVYQETTTYGSTVSWLLMAEGSTITSVGFRGKLVGQWPLGGPPGGPGVAYAGGILIHDVSRADALDVSSGVGHQVAHTFTVGGTARTEAALHVWHDEDPLGDVLVHTSSTPNGMFSLEPFIVAAGSPAGGTVSGTLKDLNAQVQYVVPANLFDPNRSTGYELVARLAREGSGNITTTVQSGHGLSAPDLVGEAQTHVVSPASSTTQRFVSLGTFTMPPHRVEGADAVVFVSIALDSPTGTPALDDVWFVDIEAGSLTWVNGADEHLWIEPVTVATPLPRVWTAADEDGTKGRDATPVSFGAHRFPPGDVHVYMVATGAGASSVQLAYYERGVINV